MIVLSPEGCSGACNGLVDLVDAAGGPGKLKIQDEAGTLLCEVQLAYPAFGDAVDGAATAAALPKSGAGTKAAGEGTKPARYDVTDAADRVVWSGTIPGGLSIDAETIQEGQVVSIVRWNHMQPAS